MNMRLLIFSTFFCFFSNCRAMEQYQLPALHEAARTGNLALVQQLANDSNINTHYDGGAKQVISIFLDAGCNINELSKEGYTPLHFAAENGHPKIVRFLLNRNADADAKSDNGTTPLHLAARNGWVEVVRLLLGYNVDINAKEFREFTPLDLASEKGYIEVVKCLVVQGACVTHKVYFKGNITVLEIASRVIVKDPVVYQYLKEIAPKTLRYTLNLLESASNNDSLNVRVAVMHEADVNASRLKGKTALHYAVEHGNSAMAKFLIKKGADLNVRDLNGNTPLHCAVQECNRAMVYILLVSCGEEANRTRLDVSNYNGQTPLDLAAQQREILKIFLLASCKDKNQVQQLRKYFVGAEVTQEPPCKKMKIDFLLNHESKTGRINAVMQAYEYKHKER